MNGILGVIEKSLKKGAHYPMPSFEYDHYCFGRKSQFGLLSGTNAVTQSKRPEVLDIVLFAKFG